MGTKEAVGVERHHRAGGAEKGGACGRVRVRAPKGAFLSCNREGTRVLPAEFPSAGKWLR